MQSSFANYRSYDDILAEANRLTELPDWVHWAGLAEAATTLFPKKCPSLSTFHEDSKPPFGITTAAGYMNALTVWKKTPVSVRNKIQKVTYYRAVYRHPKYNGENAATLLKEATRSNFLSVYSYIKGITAAVNALSTNPKLVKEFTQDNLIMALEDIQVLEETLHEEFNRRRTKRGKVA